MVGELGHYIIAIGCLIKALCIAKKVFKSKSELKEYKQAIMNEIQILFEKLIAQKRAL